MDISKIEQLLIDYDYYSICDNNVLSDEVRNSIISYFASIPKENLSSITLEVYNKLDRRLKESFIEALSYSLPNILSIEETIDFIFNNKLTSVSSWVYYRMFMNLDITKVCEYLKTRNLSDQEIRTLYWILGFNEFFTRLEGININDNVIESSNFYGLMDDNNLNKILSHRRVYKQKTISRFINKHFEDTNVNDDDKENIFNKLLTKYSDLLSLIEDSSLEITLNINKLDSNNILLSKISPSSFAKSLNKEMLEKSRDIIKDKNQFNSLPNGFKINLLNIIIRDELLSEEEVRDIILSFEDKSIFLELFDKEEIPNIYKNLFLDEKVLSKLSDTTIASLLRDAEFDKLDVEFRKKILFSKRGIEYGTNQSVEFPKITKYLTFDELIKYIESFPSLYNGSIVDLNESYTYEQRKELLNNKNILFYLSNETKANLIIALNEEDRIEYCNNRENLICFASRLTEEQINKIGFNIYENNDDMILLTETDTFRSLIQNKIKQDKDISFIRHIALLAKSIGLSTEETKKLVNPEDIIYLYERVKGFSNIEEIDPDLLVALTALSSLFGVKKANDILTFGREDVSVRDLVESKDKMLSSIINSYRRDNNDIFNNLFGRVSVAITRLTEEDVIKGENLPDIFNKLYEFVGKEELTALIIRIKRENKEEDKKDYK